MPMNRLRGVLSAIIIVSIGHVRAINASSETAFKD